VSYSSPPSSNKFFVANAALNFRIKNSVMSTQQDSLVNKSASYYKVYESPTASLSSPVSESRVLNCPVFPIRQLPQRNRLQRNNCSSKSKTLQVLLLILCFYLGLYVCDICCLCGVIKTDVNVDK